MLFRSLKSAFIPTTDIFNELVFINKSRLTFLRMKSHMQLIEDTEIATILGPTAFTFVKSEMVKANPEAKVTALLSYIRKPVAYLASALLMEESGADLTDNGLFFTSTASGFNNDTERKPATSDRIAILVTRNRNIGNAYLDQLRSYLVANSSDWREITTSSGKVSGVTIPTKKPSGLDNHENEGIKNYRMINETFQRYCNVSQFISKYFK